MNLEKAPKFNELERQPEIKEINLKELKRGDKIIVQTDEMTQYQKFLCFRGTRER